MTATMIRCWVCAYNSRFVEQILHSIVVIWARVTRSFTYFHIYFMCCVALKFVMQRIHLRSINACWNDFDTFFAPQNKENGRNMYAACKHQISLNGPVLTVHYVDHLQFWICGTEVKEQKQNQKTEKNKRSSACFMLRLEIRTWVCWIEG